MRVLIVSCAIALLTGSAVVADEPDALELSMEIQRLRDQWVRCAAAAAQKFVRGGRPADEVVSLAQQRCPTQENALERAVRLQLGPEGAHRVLELVRETDRLNLIRAIEEIRAGR